MANYRARRSIFAVPSSSEKMINKATAFKVDQIFLDLEDSVAPEAKSLARNLVFAAENMNFLAPTVSIRINALETTFFDGDLQLLAEGVGRWVDSIILPKVNSVQEIEFISGKLQEIEDKFHRKHGAISIDAQIESAKGLINCEAIAECERVASLNFGPADFMADLGMTSPRVTSNEYALMKLLVAARAAGKAAIDGPTLEVRDLTSFQTSASQSAALGFDGKWVLHPDQIDACHEIFTPSQAIFDEAACLLEAYEYFTSEAGGVRGAAMYNGAMIDEASKKMAQSVVGRAAAAGMTQQRRFERPSINL